MNQFEVYSKDGCPYCDKIKQVLEQLNLSHVVHTLNEDFSRDYFYEKFGQGTTFPQIVYGEENLGGCADTISYLRRNRFV